MVQMSSSLKLEEIKMVHFIRFDDADPLLDWRSVSKAIAAGHKLPKAEIGDQFLRRRLETLLSRVAWIDGLGIAVKTATIFPGNSKFGSKTTNGAVSIFSDENGQLEAILDFHLVTKWKTVGDSLLAATRLARPDSSQILVLGAGLVARSAIEAYASEFPAAQFKVWNRTKDNAEKLARDFRNRFRVEATADLPAAVSRADIVIGATMTIDPLLKGEWIAPGTHLDLIGAYRPDMREADDDTLVKSSIFVDSRATTISHIGELKIPIKNGVISEDSIKADYYDLESGEFARESDTEITLFKNGGGAHLDLMTSMHILQQWMLHQSHR